MPPSEKPDVLVAGHYCHDTLVSNAGVHHVLGGSAAYVSAILGPLGASFETVAKVGPDFLYAGQVARQPLIVPGARTTSFVDDYSQGERRSTLQAVCAPIVPADLTTPARCALAVGIAGEVLPETMGRLRELSGLLFADAQGLLRTTAIGEEVQLRRLTETPFAEVIGLVDYLKASVAEARFLDLPALRRRTVVLVTDGPRGCTVLTRDAELSVPAFPVIERDSTGAGDCFLAGLAVGLVRGYPLARAVRLASLCGALAVSQVGIPKLSAAELKHQEQEHQGEDG